MKSLSATFATVNNKRQAENEKELWKICSDNLFADFGGCFARTGTSDSSLLRSARGFGTRAEFHSQ